MTAVMFNNVTDTLAEAVDHDALTITVSNGGRFTDPGEGNYTPLYLLDSDGSYEIVHITAVSGDTLTVLRAQEGTSPRLFLVGDTVQVRLTKQALEELDAAGMGVETSTGPQTVAEALDDRVNKGEVGEELITTQTAPVSIQARFNEYVTPMDFGGLPGPENDASDAVEAAFLSGKPVFMGGTDVIWRVTRQLDVPLTKPMVVRSDGATITLDRETSVQRLVNVTMNGNWVYTEGPLTLECNDNSFTGAYFSNTLETNRTGIKISDWRVKNCYRANTSFTGGDGLLLLGAFTKSILSNISIKSVKAGVGAITPGVQGVAGITVTRSSVEDTDSRLCIIENCSVENIYSEDPLEKFDQDGVRVFQTYSDGSLLPVDSYCAIRNLRIKNSHGRAIKLQTEWAEVSSVFVSRDTEFAESGRTGNPEFDFQVSGGKLEGVNLRYSSHYPGRIVQATVERLSNRLNATGMWINDVSIVAVGSGSLVSPMISVSVPSSVEGSASSPIRVSVSVKNWWESGVKNYDRFLNLFGGEGTWHIDLQSCLGRPVNEWVYRNGDTYSCYVNGLGVHAPNQSPVLFNSASVGDSFVSLLGSNRNTTQP